MCWDVLVNFLGREARSSWGFSLLASVVDKGVDHCMEVTLNIQTKLLSSSGLVEQSLFIVKIVKRWFVHNLR